jgi:23S rRNA (adenine2503-C2)-methyltransferase
MKIIAQTEKSDIANVYIAETSEKKLVEFVESLQPPFPIEKKWVLIVSTLYGCPVSCSFCDCSFHYEGKISKEDIFAQIEYLIKNKFGANIVPVDKFKIQFARMGEPSFNPAVLEVLKEFPQRFDAPGFLPSISTIAPVGRDKFFDELMDIKKTLYSKSFQLQFSIHTTNLKLRDEIIPVKKWSFEQIADYGERFFEEGGRKITLNFALTQDSEIDSNILKNIFKPDYFLIKITPVNPTYKSKQSGVRSMITAEKKVYDFIGELESKGFEVIMSIGEWEENNIGSNCGQFILSHLNAIDKLNNCYNYNINFENNNIEFENS